MSKEKIKVYLYTRVSTTMQIDGYSLDAQKTKMKAFCDYNEYEIAGEYEDAGKSGKSIEGSNLSTERGGQMRKKYYDDAKENVAFERCVDVVTALILKYGPAIKRKWILRDWIKNIQADCFWRSLACKRYQRYFDCMKAIVKNDAT